MTRITDITDEKARVGNFSFAPIIDSVKYSDLLDAMNSRRLGLKAAVARAEAYGQYMKYQAPSPETRDEQIARLREALRRGHKIGGMTDAEIEQLRNWK